jgi:hypothetical protein
VKASDACHNRDNNQNSLPNKIDHSSCAKLHGPLKKGQMAPPETAKHDRQGHHFGSVGHSGIVIKVREQRA